MSARRRWRLRLAAVLGRPLLGLLARSWRVEWRGATAAIRPATRGAAAPAVLVAMWHGELLPVGWGIRRHRPVGMVSEHRDGEIIARVLRGWGYDLVRGSSTRGGGRALLALIRAIGAGRQGGITPDGPRGPAGVPQLGAIHAARRAGVAIVPVRAVVSRAWRVRSWDRFVVPKPFARVVLTAGEPWHPAGGDEDALAEFARRMGPVDVSSSRRP